MVIFRAEMHYNAFSQSIIWLLKVSLSYWPTDVFFTFANTTIVMQRAQQNLKLHSLTFFFLCIIFQYKTTGGGVWGWSKTNWKLQIRMLKEVLHTVGYPHTTKSPLQWNLTPNFSGDSSVSAYFRSYLKFSYSPYARSMSNPYFWRQGSVCDRFFLPRREEDSASTAAPSPFLRSSHNVITKKIWFLAKSKLLDDRALKLTNTSR